MSKPKIGLALGGGGARGLAHIGVLKVLERERFPFTCIVGSSMGAIVGGLYAVTRNAGRVEETVTNFINSPQFQKLGLQAFTRPDPSVPHARLDHFLTSLKLRLAAARGLRHLSVIPEDAAEEMFAFGPADTAIETLPVHFAAVATDLLSGAEVLLDRGSLLRALRASSAIPGIFPPVRIGRQLLIDGSASDSVPADLVRSLGAHVTVAVNVTKCIRQAPRLRNALDVLYRADEISTWHLTQQRLQSADFIIKPRVNTFSWANFKRFRELIRRGEVAAEQALDDLWRLYEKRMEAARTHKRRVPL